MRKSIISIFALVMCLTVSSCGGTPAKESVVKKEYNSTYVLEEAKLENSASYSAENVSLELTDIVYDKGVTRLKLYVKNDSREKVKVMTDELSINGFMSTERMYTDLDKKEEKEAFVEIGNDWFSKLGIKQISEICLTLYVLNENGMPLASSGLLTVKTDAREQNTPEFNPQGTELYNENGVRLVFCGVKKSEFSNDTEAEFYVENNGEIDFTVITNDVLVNGEQIDGSFIMPVNTGKKSIDTLLFYKSSLDKHNIKDFKTLEVGFKILTDNEKIVYETGLLSIPINKQ